MISFKYSTVVLLLSGQNIWAQRRDQSICDYYAATLYGENNATTQLKLMQSIVANAYAGSNSLPNGDKRSTGIFNPGEYKGQDVYLRPWFDGSNPTSNNNDQAVNINWLDGGGTAPLVAFLNGSTSTPEIKKGTNQFKLFTHWYYVFGKVYSCSLFKNFLEQAFAPLNPAYVHKYMNLNSTHVGYFIDQLVIASQIHNFSDSDAQTLSTAMNAKYNARCLPPVDNSLNSICLADDCPVAAPSPNCEVYKNTKQRGLDTSALPSSTPTSSSSSSSIPAAGSGNSSSHLPAGAIAGIAIGGAVVILLAVGMFLFFRRQNRHKPEEVVTPATPAPVQMQPASPGHPPQYAYGSSPHESYYGRNPTDSYVSSQGNSLSPAAWVEAKQRPEEMSAFSPVSPYPPTSPSPMPHLAEMESPEPPSGWNRQNQPATPNT